MQSSISPLRASGRLVYIDHSADVESGRSSNNSGTFIYPYCFLIKVSFRLGELSGNDNGEAGPVTICTHYQLNLDRFLIRT